MGKSNGNRYSEKFKQGAVKLVLENKQNVAEACRNLGVSRGTMERWLAAEADSHEPDKIRLQLTAIPYRIAEHGIIKGKR